MGDAEKEDEKKKHTRWKVCGTLHMRLSVPRHGTNVPPDTGL
jgi:hypothetical protein